VAAAAFTGALVEVYGTNALVTEHVGVKVGEADFPCATGASPTWYLADGTTIVDTTYDLLVLNPFPDEAIVDVSFDTDEGPRAPAALQGFGVPPRSLRTIDVAAAVQRDQRVATSVKARNGRVVVGRHLVRPANPSKGLLAGLASPSAGSQWWFSNGGKNSTVAESLVLYNPGEDDVTANVTVFPVDPAAEGATTLPLTPTVRAGTAVQVQLSNNDQLPDGRHSIVVTTPAGQSIVAERRLDLVSGNRVAPTLQAGSRLAASKWYVPSGAPNGGDAFLTITNVTGVANRVSVAALGPAGLSPVEGLRDVNVAAGATVQFDLGASGVAGAVTQITADTAVVVEQFVVPGANQPGAWSTRAVPVEGT
jgi:hypothetical protein